MRSLTYILLFSFVVLGCKSSFKSNFKNFNAYYNTFYNAKKSFKLGEEKSLEQARNYNTLQPIRVYETPLGAGASDFDNAIEKGASILRKFDETKWVDDAIEIIGKSYYYRQEYFSADQKFDELYINSTNDEMKQRAVYWKGRVLYEFQVHQQGIQYLTEQLTLLEGTWTGNIEFQVKVILAEHYIVEENWVLALDLLNESIPRIPGKANKERGFFLIGQLYEILGNSEGAFAAYDQVGRHYNNYDLQFEAKKKKAEVARSLGNYDEASSVFSSMVRDDKNTEFVAELNFELGKTEQERENYERAERIYKSILNDPFNSPSNNTKALTYNGLAEIYRFNYQDFTLAAAYYDSSARLNIPVEQLPEDYNAKVLADSFGEYASIKDQIHVQDSLLWLGSLSDEEFDSVLVEIEQRMIAEMERLRKEQEEQRNTLVNIDPTQTNNNPNANRSGTNGFLNIDNPVLVADAREQFTAIWQNRPLVDNWRVNELIVNTLQSDSSFTQGIAQNQTSNEQTLVNIDLSNIPFTQSDQDSMRNEQATLKYELGNLFFLSLNLPDSAEFYFENVLNEYQQSDVEAINLYSLSELYSINGEEEQSISYAQILIQNYPNTEYADRLAEKFDLQISEYTEKINPDPIQTYISLSTDNSVGYFEKAQRLYEFSMSNSNSEVSDRALYESIRGYINEGMSSPSFRDSLYIWQNMNFDWQDSLTIFEERKVTALAMLSDSTITLSPADSIYYKSVVDSTFTVPDIRSYFPYYGAIWDSSRTRIQTFLTNYSNSPYNDEVLKLKDEIALPIFDEVVIDEQIDTVTAPVGMTNESYYDCQEINQYPVIRNGMDGFNELLQIDSNVNDEVITFLFYINSRGVIDEFSLFSETENESLINQYVDAIDSYVSFDPILVDGEASPIVCAVEFEIPKN